MSENLVTLTMGLILGGLVVFFGGQAIGKWVLEIIKTLFSSIGKILVIAIVIFILYCWIINPEYGDEVYDQVKVHLVKGETPKRIGDIF